jgi:hypothetical protein
MPPLEVQRKASFVNASGPLPPAPGDADWVRLHIKCVLANKIERICLRAAVPEVTDDLRALGHDVVGLAMKGANFSQGRRRCEPTG